MLKCQSRLRVGPFGKYHPLPMYHAYTEVRIKFSALIFLSYFVSCIHWSENKVLGTKFFILFCRTSLYLYLWDLRSTQLDVCYVWRRALGYVFQTFGEGCFFHHCFLLWLCGQMGAMASSFLRFLDHTQRSITVGRTPLDEWSARRRDLYLTTHYTHNKHPCPSRIRTHDLSRRAAVDLSLRPRGRWDRRFFHR